MQLDSFEVQLYSTQNCLTLFKAGLNPKFNLYKWDAATRREVQKQWVKRFGDSYTSLPSDFWYSPKDLTCTDCQANCGDGKGAFHFAYGFRTKKSEKIGKGGFGDVYKGKIHGRDKAVKFVNIRDSYMKNVISYQPGKTADECVSGLFGEAAHEANVYLTGNLKHPNILPLDEFWLQFSRLSKMELALSSQLCYCNLKEWTENEPYNFDQLVEFLLQMTRALEHLSLNEIMHRDMKPANVLITTKIDPVAQLTDFGLSKPDISGLTPGFCSPEQMTKQGSKLGKTDIYSLAVSIILTLFREKLGMALVFMPRTDIPPDRIQKLNKNPLVKLAQKMLAYEPQDRINFDEVRKTLQGITSAAVALDVPGESDISNLGQTMAHLSIVDKSIINQAKTTADMLSVAVRDQRESGFCWAFSTAKLVAAEFRKFINKLHDDHMISPETLRKAIKMANKVNDGNRLVYEIICLVAPRDPQMVGISEEKTVSQTAELNEQVKKLCEKTILKTEGWKMLPSLVSIVKVRLSINYIIEDSIILLRRHI